LKEFETRQLLETRTRETHPELHEHELVHVVIPTVLNTPEDLLVCVANDGNEDVTHHCRTDSVKGGARKEETAGGLSAYTWAHESGL
jgi:hypothetical protein